MSIIIDFYIALIGSIYIAYKKIMDKKYTKRSKEESERTIESLKYIFVNYCDDCYHTIEKDINKRIKDMMSKVYYIDRIHEGRMIVDDDIYKMLEYYEKAVRIENDTCGVRDNYRYTILLDIVMAEEYKRMPYGRYYSGYTEKPIAIWVYSHINNKDLVLYEDTNLYNGKLSYYFHGTNMWFVRNHNLERKIFSRKRVDVERNK